MPDRNLLRIAIIAAAATYPSLTYSAPSCGFYQYRATVVSIYDADTIRADIDLGFNTWRRNEQLRLFGIDAPEMKGDDKEAGTISRDALRGRILNKEVTICTIKDRREKYGRYLAKIYLGDELINDWLLEKGFAIPYEGSIPEDD